MSNLLKAYKEGFINRSILLQKKHHYLSLTKKECELITLFFDKNSFFTKQEYENILSLTSKEFDLFSSNLIKKHYLKIEFDKKNKNLFKMNFDPMFDCLVEFIAEPNDQSTIQHKFFWIIDYFQIKNIDSKLQDFIEKLINDENFTSIMDFCKTIKKLKLKNLDVEILKKLFHSFNKDIIKNIPLEILNFNWVI